MIAALALAAQSLALPPGQSVAPVESEREAMTCAVASTVVNTTSEVPRMRANAETTYYVLQAAQATVKTENGQILLRQFSKLSSALSSYPIPSEAEAAAQIKRCDTLYPVARSKQVALPDDSFEADVMCIAVLPLTKDLATLLVNITYDTDEPLRWDRLIGVYGTRLTDELMTARGYTDASKIATLVDRQLPASLRIGNVYSIALACEARAKN